MKDFYALIIEDFSVYRRLTMDTLYSCDTIKKIKNKCTYIVNKKIVHTSDVRETGASRHNESSIEGPLKAPCTIVL